MSEWDPLTESFDVDQPDPDSREPDCTCGHPGLTYDGPDKDCPEHGCASVMTPTTVACVPNTPGTPRRTIRVPDTLWDAASSKAEERGESVSDVIRRALERYVRSKR